MSNAARPSGVVRLVHGLRLLALTLLADALICLVLVLGSGSESPSGFAVFYLLLTGLFAGMACLALLLAPRIHRGEARAATHGLALAVALAVIGLLTAGLWLLPLAAVLLDGAPWHPSLALLFIPPLPTGIVVGGYLKRMLGHAHFQD